MFYKCNYGKNSNLRIIILNNSNLRLFKTHQKSDQQLATLIQNTCSYICIPKKSVIIVSYWLASYIASS